MGECVRTKRAVAMSAAVATVVLSGGSPAYAVDRTFNISLVGALNPLAGQGATNNIYADVWGEGNVVALGSVGTGSGVTLINNSNPAAPVAYPNRYMPAGSANGQFRDVIIQGGIGYFAIDSSTTGGPTTVGGVHVVNLANPAAPALLTVIKDPIGFYNNHDLFLDANFLYISNNRTYEMKVFNVANPASPTLVRSINTAGVSTDDLHDMTIKNGRMYTSNLSNGITQIYDVSQMSTTVAPTLLGSLDVGTRNHTAWPSEDGKLLAVAREAENAEVQLWNISTPATPTLIGSITSAAYGIDSFSAHNPVIIGDTLYVSWYQAGLQIFNIRNPAAPVHLGAFDTFVGGNGGPTAPGSFANGYDGNWGLYPDLGNNKILLSDFDNGFFTVDATDAFRQIWTYTFDTGKWQEQGRWDSNGPVPDSSEMIASFTNAPTGNNRTLTVDGALAPAKPRVAAMQFSGSLGYTIRAINGGEIELKSSGGPAEITMAAPSGTVRPSFVAAPIALEDDLIVTNNAGATAAPTLELNVIKATNRAITFAGTGVTALVAANSQLTGSFVLAGGTLQISADDQLGNAANTLTFNGGVLRTAGAVVSNRALTVGAGGGAVDSNGFDSGFGDLGIGNFTKNGAGKVAFRSIKALNLTLSSGTLAVKNRATTGGNQVARVSSLSIAPSAAFDLNDNDLVVASGNFNALQALVLGGYRVGVDTAATGIVSTTSQTVHGGTTILALFDNALAGFTDWPAGSGNSIATGAIVGKYTYIGDTNMDGQVTAQDYTAIDANLGTNGINPGIAWFYGDTNFDGNIAATDYTGIDAALGLGQGNPLMVQGRAAVPEPMSLGLLALGTVGLIGRRRRKA